MSRKLGTPMDKQERIARETERQDERITELEAVTANILETVDNQADNTQESFRLRVIRVIKDLQEAFKKDENHG